MGQKSFSQDWDGTGIFLWQWDESGVEIDSLYSLYCVLICTTCVLTCITRILTRSIPFSSQYEVLGGFG